jgi:uncharacterized protein (TIGR02996 family)
MPDVPMSAEERTRLRAILIDPDADEPRLSFADWVETSDPARAAMIRHQVENPDEETTDRVTFAAWGARDVIVRRGFAEAMSLTGRSFVSLSDRLFAATPLRDVRLIAVNFLMADLVLCPNLAKLRRLELQGNQIGREGLALLAACPYLSHLLELNLARNGLDDETVPLILRSTWAPVRVLTLTGNRFSPAAIAELTSTFGTRVRIA